MDVQNACSEHKVTAGWDVVRLKGSTALFGLEEKSRGDLFFRMYTLLGATET